MALATLSIWLNGALLGAEDARLSALDHGLIVGNGAFESLKVTRAGAFAVRRHLDRLSRSARALNLPDPDHGLVREGIAAVLDGRPYAFGKLRITYTAGLGPLGSQAPFGPPNLVVAAAPYEPPVEPAVVLTAPWVRNERGALTGVKSTSYAENVRALAYATGHGASEAIFANTRGLLCEGTGTNVFCVFDGRVVTPPLTAGPLAGITRELLCEWADVEEDQLTMAEAQAADEVFVTSSLREVQAVRRWDDRTYAAPATRTASLRQLFAQRAANDIDP